MSGELILFKLSGEVRRPGVEPKTFHLNISIGSSMAIYSRGIGFESRPVYFFERPVYFKFCYSSFITAKIMNEIQVHIRVRHPIGLTE